MMQFGSAVPAPVESVESSVGIDPDRKPQPAMGRRRSLAALPRQDHVGCQAIREFHTALRQALISFS
jgi:hypothetical protein